MNIKAKIFSLAVPALLATSFTASAAVIDFTDAGTSLIGGAVEGTTYTVSGNPEAPNNTQPFDAPNTPANSFGLAFDQDGLGIKTDELDGASTPPESVTITFGKALRITGFAFLDLFKDPIAGNPDAGEFGIATINGTDYILPFQTGNQVGGYAEFLFPGVGIKTTSVTFTAGTTNDNAGVADGALAALQVAPVPLPAGVLLMGTALAGFGVMSRRRKKASA